MEFEKYFSMMNESVSFLRQKIKTEPKLLVVLTGGLDSFVSALENQIVLLSHDIPHFPRPHAEGHSGKIVFGTRNNIPIVTMQGRSHYYEGLSAQSVVFPYFVFEKLGVKTVITTNAVGGINKSLKAGDIMMVNDHINMMGTNPLIGLSISRKTDQFTDLTNPYDQELREMASKIAKKKGIDLKEGVYLACTGPSYETKAEIKMFGKMGADTVGMSTVFEVIACNFLKMRVLTLNCIANSAAGLHKEKLGHEEVLKSMASMQDKLVNFLGAIASEI